MRRYTSLILSLKLLLLSLVIWISGCGVKGDPASPMSPAEIGRGQPIYRRATEEFDYPVAPTPPSTEEEDNNNSKDTEE